MKEVCGIVLIIIYAFFTAVYIDNIVNQTNNTVTKMYDKSEIPSEDKIGQVLKDWSTRPFTDIIVVEEDSCPATHPDLVFYRPFFGTELTCVCGRHVYCDRDLNSVCPGFCPTDGYY